MKTINTEGAEPVTQNQTCFGYPMKTVDLGKVMAMASAVVSQTSEGIQITDMNGASRVFPYDAVRTLALEIGQAE